MDKDLGGEMFGCIPSCCSTEPLAAYPVAPLLLTLEFIATVCAMLSLSHSEVHDSKLLKRETGKDVGSAKVTEYTIVVTINTKRPWSKRTSSSSTLVFPRVELFSVGFD